MPTKKATRIDFEKSLEKLNKLVDKMEQGNLPLEESLKSFEEGVGLIRQCQEALNKAEQKVKILTEKQGKDVLETFESDE